MHHLLINANVYTMDPARPRASVIVVTHDRIEAVGGDELRFLATPRTRIHNMAGATVVPAFCDAHIHWSWTALNMKQLSLHDVPSKAEALGIIARAAEEMPDGKWIVGFGWAQSLWNNEFPTAADLDAITPNNPVFMDARSGHAAWVNSLAMKIAGITDSTANPHGGEIQRDRSGHATGILFEEAKELVARMVPQPTVEEIARAVEDAQPAAWAAGIASMHDYDQRDAFDAYQLLHFRKRLGVRIRKNINDPYIDHAYRLGMRSGLGDDWLHVGGLKMFADGALGSVTAQMLEPYIGQPENRGIVVTTRERMEELAQEATRLGFPSTIHAIGDEAVRHTLDVLESTRSLERQLGIIQDERRHRIEHAQILHPDDIPRFRELDVVASLQPIHATADMELAEAVIGERARYAYNPRIQIDQGVHVVFGSDSPVEPFEPIKTIHAAVTRRRPDGSPGAEGWWPEARITVEEAVRCYTVEPAWVAHQEDRLGQLSEGYLADLTVLDRDIFAIDPNDLLKTQVLGTMVEGDWKWGEWKAD